MIIISTQFKSIEEKNYFFLKLAKFYFPYIIAIVFIFVLFEPILTKFISDILYLESSTIIYSAIYWAILYSFTSLFFLFFHSSFQAINDLKIANIYQGFLTLIPGFSLIFSFFFKLRIDSFFFTCFLISFVFGIIMAFHYLLCYSSKITFENSYRSSINNIVVTSSTSLVLNIISVSISNLDILMLSNFSISDSDIVNFSVLQKIILLQTMIFGTICSTLLPMFGKWYGSNNFHLIRLNFNIFLKTLLTVASFIIFFNILFMKDIIEIWIGKTGFIGNEILVILSLSIYIYITYTLSYTVLHSFNIKRKLTLIFTVLETFFKIFISYFLIKYFGHIGAAFGVLVFGLLVEFPLYTCMLNYYSYKKIQLDIGFLFKHSMLMIVYLYFLYQYVSSLIFEIRIVSFVLISFLYLLSNYLLLSSEDKRLLSKLKNK
jgi:O-antigen/teichoic acid export membrane protein